MIGCHVDKARTGVRGDMLGSDEGAGLGEEALEFVHRMASNRSGQIGAFTRPDNMFIGDGEISASGQSRDQVFGEKNRFGWPRRSNRTLADGSGDLYRHIIDVLSIEIGRASCRERVCQYV